MRAARDERGGVTLMVAIFTVALLGIASFAIDLGLQRVGVRDMQALADVVAMDMARELDGRSRGELLADPGWEAAREASLARNADTFGEDPGVTAEPGVFDQATRTVDTTSTDPADAVLVTAGSSVSFVFQKGEGAFARTAVAQAASTACFALGSYAARFRSGDSALLSTLVSPMNAFVRPQANLDLLSYQGLANASVTLNELAATSDVGTVDELLTGTVTAGQLIRASITALQRQNPTNSVAVSALNAILKGSAKLDTPVALTNVVAISPTDSAAAQTHLNVLDLVAGTILLADGEHFLNVPNLSAGIGNLSPDPSTSSLKVIQKPQTACGDDTARTAQLTGNINMPLQLQTMNITGHGVVHTPNATVNASIDLGKADGNITAPGPSCDPDLIPVEVRSALATLRAVTTLRFATTVEIDLLLTKTKVDVDFEQIATAEVPMPAQTQGVTLEVPPNDTEPVSVGTAGPLGPFSVAGTATILKASIGGVTVTDPTTLELVRVALAPVAAGLAVDTRVTDPLNKFVANLNNYLTPVRTLLGLQVSGVDVFAVGRPTCNGAVLRG